MNSYQTSIDEPALLDLKRHHDDRGWFMKVIPLSHPQLMISLDSNFEIYFSHSMPEVIRGLHLQVPPHDHSKCVFVTKGIIEDVTICVNPQRTDFGEIHRYELRDDESKLLYVPRGFAHGFRVVEGPATLGYIVSSLYSAGHDTGINFSEVPEWRDLNPTVSSRDRALPSLEVFRSQALKNCWWM